MVDIHCHILPGVDDGAQSWEMAVQMCVMAVADGIDHIVATPHANDEFTYDRENFAALLDKLRASAPQGLRFSLGCDFHFSFENIQDATRTPDKYLISGTDYLLIELSDFSISPAIGSAIARICSTGIIPILTHPERNMILQSRPEQVVKFAEAGCLIQITANSLTGYWGERARKAATWLLDRGAVHVISSDAHDLNHRPPRISEARAVVQESYGMEMANYLTELNPRAIVSNQPVPYAPKIAAK